MVTAIYETKNCRTWFTATSYSAAVSRLSKIERENKKSFKLISVNNGVGLKSNTSAKVVA
jgi:hypothetical protein